MSLSLSFSLLSSVCVCGVLLISLAVSGDTVVAAVVVVVADALAVCESDKAERAKGAGAVCEGLGM